MILAITEQQEGQLKNLSWETIAGAQQLAAVAGGAPITVAVIGASIGDAARQVAQAAVQRVITVEDPALGVYTADGFVLALAAVVARLTPAYVVLPHTYQTRDFAPKLAAKLACPLVTDVVAIKAADGRPVFTRLMFQGKLAADVVPEGRAPSLVTFQIGAFRADAAARGAAAAPITILDVPIDAAAIRQRPEARFREAKAAVDLSQAERIVAVGRGLKAKEQLPLAERLAALLNAEVGASRPICDAGWLPPERQIGSSGLTVSPKLY
ncbi:MAG: electron transfer flavoprotein subunit alpha/FixB family protein, partial [Acidobacteria bacterium]|nr:electron transfer flavoprotein subunit alpha/FixB family protein [Acidobacteriota bacterium]